MLPKPGYMLRHMKTIYANIAWYVITVYGLVGAAFYRQSSKDWQSMPDARMSYDLLYVGLACYLIICAIGLLLRRKWGYIFCVSANTILALVPFAIFVASMVMVLPAIDFLSLLKMNLLVCCMGSQVLGFWFCYVSLKQREDISGNSMGNV